MLSENFFVKPIIPPGINIGKSEARPPSVGPPTQPLATISEAETDRLVSEQVEVSEDLAPSEPQSLLADVPSASSSSSPSSSLSELDPLLLPFPPSQSSSKPSLPSRPSSRTRLISHSPTTDSSRSSSSSNSSSTPVGDPCIRDQPYLPPSTPSSLPPSYSSPSFSSSSPPCYTKALETALDLGQLRVQEATQRDQEVGEWMHICAMSLCIKFFDLTYLAISAGNMNTFEKPACRIVNCISANILKYVHLRL